MLTSQHLKALSRGGEAVNSMSDLQVRVEETKKQAAGNALSRLLFQVGNNTLCIIATVVLAYILGVLRVPPFQNSDINPQVVNYVRSSFQR